LSSTHAIPSSTSTCTVCQDITQPPQYQEP
jgi:hypothetical protein